MDYKNSSAVTRCPFFKPEPEGQAALPAGSPGRPARVMSLPMRRGEAGYSRFFNNQSLSSKRFEMVDKPLAKVKLVRDIGRTPTRAPVFLTKPAPEHLFYNINIDSVKQRSVSYFFDRFVGKMEVPSYIRNGRLGTPSVRERNDSLLDMCRARGRGGKKMPFFMDGQIGSRLCCDSFTEKSLAMNGTISGAA